MPPTRKKNSDTAPYMMPSFLWSTVKIHDFQPVSAVGRRVDESSPMIDARLADWLVQTAAREGATLRHTHQDVAIELGTAVLQTYTSHPVLQFNRAAAAAFQR